MMLTRQNEELDSGVDWSRLLGKFIDLPGASGISNLPDIGAYNEQSLDDDRYDLESASRWESEGGQIVRRVDRKNLN